MATPKKRSEAGRLAEEMHAARIQLVDDAGKALEAIEQIRVDYEAKLAAATATYDERWHTAVEAGWTAPELTTLGLTKPASAKRKPRKKATPATPAADTVPAAQDNESIPSAD